MKTVATTMANPNLDGTKKGWIYSFLFYIFYIIVQAKSITLALNFKT